jgi:hypothetical protein
MGWVNAASNGSACSRLTDLYISQLCAQPDAAAHRGGTCARKTGSQVVCPDKSDRKHRAITNAGGVSDHFDLR